MSQAEFTDDIDAVRDEKRNLSRFAEQVAADDLLWLMKGEKGRRIVWDLLAECRVYTLSYEATGTNQTHFNEGRRYIGVTLMSRIFALPDGPNLHAQMIQEGQANARKYSAKRPN